MILFPCVNQCSCRASLHHKGDIVTSKESEKVDVTNSVDKLSC